MKDNKEIDSQNADIQQSIKKRKNFANMEGSLDISGPSYINKTSGIPRSEFNSHGIMAWLRLLWKKKGPFNKSTKQ